MQSSKYELYIFDMDGTLMDTSPGILRSIRHTIEHFHKRMPEDDVLKKFIGPPLRLSFAALPDVAINEVDDMVAAFRKHYSEQELFNARIYDGIQQLCECLHNNNVKIAVATNKPENFAKQLVQYFELDKNISIVCGADAQGTLTKADLIFRAMDFSQTYDKSKAVMVGDTIGDADAAYECGLEFIGVTYGFGLSDNKDDAIRTKAIRMASSPSEIYE